MNALLSALTIAVLLAVPGAAETRPSRELPAIQIDDRGVAREREILEAALAKIKGTPTSRRLEPRRRRVPGAIVSFARFDDDPNPTLDGAFHGRTRLDRVPTEIVLNEKLAASTGTLIVETLAHELYGHALIVPEAAKEGVDIGWLVEHEGFSLAVGDLIAREAGEPARDEDRIDWIAESTAAYCDGVLFTDSPQRIELSLAEARDPKAAVAARLVELARRRTWISSRRRAYAAWTFRLDQLESVHGLDPRSTADLRESLRGLADDAIPQRQAILDAAEPHLRTVQTWLDEPEGKIWIATMTAVAASPVAARLEREWARLGIEIRARRAEETSKDGRPSAAPLVRQLTWDDLGALVEKDRAAHPDHWTSEPRTDGPDVPWNLVRSQ
jgi:hypothetical protein